MIRNYVVEEFDINIQFHTFKIQQPNNELVAFCHVDEIHGQFIIGKQDISYQSKGADINSSLLMTRSS